MPNLFPHKRPLQCNDEVFGSDFIPKAGREPSDVQSSLRSYLFPQEMSLLNNRPRAMRKLQFKVGSMRWRVAGRLGYGWKPKKGRTSLLVECGGGGPLVVLHRDGDADAVLRRTESRRQEGRVLRAAALVHAEFLTVVLLAAHHHQVVEQRGLRHPHVSVTWGAT